MPFASAVAKVNDIEFQQIIESKKKSMEDLIEQFKGQETLPMREILGLDKQLRSIRGLLKVEAAKKVQLEEHIKKENRKLESIPENTTMAFEKTSPSKSTS